MILWRARRDGRGRPGQETHTGGHKALGFQRAVRSWPDATGLRQSLKLKGWPHLDSRYLEFSGPPNSLGTEKDASVVDL